MLRVLHNAEALRASSEVEMSVDGMPLHLAHKWAAMRDCVGRGREYKYDALQSEYHCACALDTEPSLSLALRADRMGAPSLACADTKDKKLLAAALAQLPAES